jgi:hypothetical protein
MSITYHARTLVIRKQIRWTNEGMHCGGDGQGSSGVEACASGFGADRQGSDGQASCTDSGAA